MKNRKAKEEWMNDRMAKGYSFTYYKGLVKGVRMNIGVKCIETGEQFYFDWETE